MRTRRLLTLSVFGLLVVGALMISACGKGPLGTEKNPIVWVFVPSGEVENVTAGGEAMADLLFEETGLVVDVIVATDNSAAIEAMCNEEAQMGSLNTFSYIRAADLDCAEAALVATRYGSPTYNGQIFVHADSGFTDVSDLDGVTFCRDDALSTSSWILPNMILEAAGITVTPKDSGSHDAAVAGVYNGECEAGASYIDARGNLEEEYPDVLDVIKVIYQTTEIPNDGVQFIPGFDPELRTQLFNALLAIAETEAGQEALDTAYSWAGLEEHDDSFYDPFRQMLDAAGISPADME